MPTQCHPCRSTPVSTELAVSESENQTRAQSGPRTRLKITGINTEFVLRKSFCIYRFEQTSRYRQRVLIYTAAQDVKMSAKTIRYLQMDYSGKYRLRTSFITKRLVLYTVSQIQWAVQLKTKKWQIYMKSNVSPIERHWIKMYLHYIYML